MTAEQPIYEVKLHCSPFPPTSVKGSQRRVCIIVETIMRDMHDADRTVRIECVNSNAQIDDYLDDVRRELMLIVPRGRGRGPILAKTPG